MHNYTLLTFGVNKYIVPKENCWMNLCDTELFFLSLQIEV